MELKHLSSSSTRLWLQCPAQWHAKYQREAPDVGNALTNQGTLIHTVLEKFSAGGLWSLGPQMQRDILRGLFMDLIVTSGIQPDDILRVQQEGWELLESWFERWDAEIGTPARMGNLELSSVEGRREFMLELGGDYPDVPFVYIQDLQVCEDGMYRTRDYKTGFKTLTVQQMLHDIQVRSYATALWKEFPEQGRYPVELDYLRRDNVRKVTFTTKQCMDHYEFLCGVARDIIDAEEAEYRLNPGCRYCAIKNSCPEFERWLEIKAGDSLDTESLVDLRANWDHIAEAAKQAGKELDEQILRRHETDKRSVMLGTDGAKVELKPDSARSVDKAKAKQLLTAEELADIGSVTITAINELIKDCEDEDRKAQLRGLIVRTPKQRPKIVVTRKEMGKKT